MTRLPFPVHVVERVETVDRVSGNRFVTRYAYHHGYFDGVEREFRGFGMVEQWDTEEFAALPRRTPRRRRQRRRGVARAAGADPRRWFHTGVYLDATHVASPATLRPGEYYREPGLERRRGRARCCSTTRCCPTDLTADEEREACRALKGAMLRQEVYALDGAATSRTSLHGHRAELHDPPCCSRRRATATRCSSPTRARRSRYHYERDPDDPRDRRTR